jgi:hypothetical protein
MLSLIAAFLLLGLNGCGRGEPLEDSTSGGGSTTSGSTSGSSGGSPTAGSTGSATSGGGEGLSTAGAFAVNTQLASEDQEYTSVGQRYSSSSAEIILGDFALGAVSCAEATDGGVPVGQILGIAFNAASGGSVDVGNYPIIAPSSAPSSAYATVFLVAFDADGGMQSLAVSASGNLQIAQIRPSVAGSFTSALTLSDGGAFGTMSGTFDAEWCSPTP